MTLRLLTLLLALCAPAAGQYLYALNQAGKLTVNGTVLDSLPGDFDEAAGPNNFERWLAFDVLDGKGVSDRHALRFDGRLQSNGKKAAEFNMGLDGSTGQIYGWRLVDATPNGVYLLRQEGLLVKGETSVVSYPFGDFFFTGLVVRSVGPVDTVFALRSDGAIFSGTGTTAVARLQASVGQEPDDGSTLLTTWFKLVPNTLGTTLYALRVDGRLWSIDVEDIEDFISTGTGDLPAGSEVAQLPEPSSELDFGDQYVDLSFGGTTWRALQARGAVYTSASVIEPFAEYDNSGGELGFVATLGDASDTWALREDGALFKNTAENQVVLNLVGENYIALAASTEPPDLTSFKNPQPVASPYTVTLREGVPASVPVLVSDVEKLPSELTVTTDPDLPLPAEFEFLEVDDGNGGLIRTLEWNGTDLAGKYKARLLVSDGVTKPRKFMTTVIVKAADLDPEKNKKPVPCKVKQVLAQAGYELRVPILADDLDGDVLTLSVDETKYPFTAGAAFDAQTGVFTWTPTTADLGKKSFKVRVSDGIKTVTRTVKLKVISPLIFDDGGI